MSKKEKSTYEIMEDGAQAERLLTDPVFCEATDALEEKWTIAWKKARTTEERERMWALVQALYGVKEELGLTKSRGEMEAVHSRRISTR